VALIADRGVHLRVAGESPAFFPRVRGVAAGEHLAGAVIKVFPHRGDGEPDVDLLLAAGDLCAGYDRIIDRQKRQQVVPVGGDVATRFASGG